MYFFIADELSIQGEEMQEQVAEKTLPRQTEQAVMRMTPPRTHNDSGMQHGRLHPKRLPFRKEARLQHADLSPSCARQGNTDNRRRPPSVRNYGAGAEMSPVAYEPIFLQSAITGYNDN